MSVRFNMLSNLPLTPDRGAHGDTLLHFTFKVKLRQRSQFGNVDEGRKPYREWCVPAAFIKKLGVVLAWPFGLSMYRRKTLTLPESGIHRALVDFIPKRRDLSCLRD
jgi:hypothetical protein